jgi:hypothetical protein
LCCIRLYLENELTHFSSEEQALPLVQQADVPIVLAFVKDTDNTVIDGTDVVLHNLVPQKVIFRVTAAATYHSDLARLHDRSDSHTHQHTRKSSNMPRADKQKSSNNSRSKNAQHSSHPANTHQKGHQPARPTGTHSEATPAIPWVRTFVVYACILLIIIQG